MSMRSFQDAAGTQWQVFEVHRTSDSSVAVSAGHEGGWLAFVSGERKRRLAPFPPGWNEASVVELASLCAMATSAPAAQYPLEEWLRRRSLFDVADRPPASEPERAPPAVADPLEATVRAFAHRARAAGTPAVSAMVQLKALLVDQLGDEEKIDLRRVRRWFVEAFYFEREA